MRSTSVKGTAFVARVAFLLGVAAGFGALVFACSSSKSTNNAASDCATLSTTCPSTPPGFAADVEPILATKCSTCHAMNVPDGQWPLDDYQNVKDWDIAILADLQSCVMPPSSSHIALSSSERQVIADWIACGETM